MKDLKNIYDAVEHLRECCDTYFESTESLGLELFEVLLAIETVLDYVEVDLAVEDLSLEGCSCGDCV